MARRAFVDIWEVFDGNRECIGWVPEFGEFSAWADALEALTPQLERNLWSLRTEDSQKLCPFGTKDSLCYRLILRDDGVVDGAEEVLAYTVAIRATAL